ncbi:LysM domain-containing protein [Colletotrichum karsti]|uniref:LysM domain-containing protein n=1 Tax=Colletotrichum karsti TaxID=1095194 RepID=A0A9P6IB15_9PEZI|nr:LysM domain-containing protein [Colletotrichum karsti]KAF9879529.1 LysM domain-containing protein [Colletotrichum karsti]
MAFISRILVILMPYALAQQFTGFVSSYEYFDLSASCLRTLNTTLECSGRLASHANFESHRVDVLDADGIATICTAECRQSMEDLRSRIESDCDPKNDLLDHGLTLFPATHILDRYIYTYEISCYTDRDSGEPCDSILGTWRNQTDDGPHDCHDCILGPMEIEVNSEIGHTEDRAIEFQAAVLSCSKTGYTYTQPSTHSTASAAPAESTIAALGWSAQRMSADCASTYHVRDGDTCERISAEQSVSSKGLIEANDVINGWCNGLEAGQELCMPAKCDVHFIQPGDSCESLGEKYGATPKDLQDWNPLMYIQCDDFEYTKSTYVCVGRSFHYQEELHICDSSARYRNNDFSV